MSAEAAFRTDLHPRNIMNVESLLQSKLETLPMVL